VSAEPDSPRPVLFGEELWETPLPQLLAEAQEHLRELGERYRKPLTQNEQVELLDEALDELDAALVRVREARAKLARIEVRLATSYESAVARIRQTERDDSEPS
jgi:hypothetical protein